MAYDSPSLFSTKAALLATCSGALCRGPFIVRLSIGIIPQFVNMTGLLGEGEEFFKDNIKKLPLEKYEISESTFLALTWLPTAAAIQSLAIYTGLLLVAHPITFKEAAFSGTLSLLLAIDSYHGSKTIDKVARYIDSYLKK
jgi:hypothetical protein